MESLIWILRRLFILLCAGGGVWVAHNVLDYLARRADPRTAVDLWAPESMLLVAPILIMGALTGSFLGALFLPADKK